MPSPAFTNVLGNLLLKGQLGDISKLMNKLSHPGVTSAQRGLKLPSKHQSPQERSVMNNCQILPKAKR